VEALMAAYNESEAWLDELQLLLYDNYRYLSDVLREQMPMLTVTRAEGTYLAWVNVTALGIPSETLCQQLAAQEKVLFNPSEMYGGKGYIRINLATSREILTEALQRLHRFISAL